MNLLIFVERFSMLILAVLLDLAFGEPPDRIHPTVWMGKMIRFLDRRLHSRFDWIMKAYGVLMALIVVGVFTLSSHFILHYVQAQFGQAAYIVVGALLLKPTFAIKYMKQKIHQIAEHVRAGDVDGARRLLPYIVRRNPAELDVRHILSAAVESTAESTVDGVTSPIFYFALFGVPGAIAFRAINTLDSMVGYKDEAHIHVGWFSAKLDTLANLVPARLTALLMIIAAWLLHLNCESAWKIMWRDRGETESQNAGWVMAAMAGALMVQLEKQGHYRLGDDQAKLSPDHPCRALQVMELTAYLFMLFVAAPILAAETLL